MYRMARTKQQQVSASCGNNSIESVQELVQQPSHSIPTCFIQPTNHNNNHNSNIPTIPVIDMQILISGSQEERSLELDKFHTSCKDWGIFQMVNHGVGGSVVEKLNHEVEEFYKLPLEEKLRYKIRAGEVEGYGQTIVHSQGGSADWADRLYMIVNPFHRRKLHLFPQLPSSLREALEDYFKELQRLSMEVFGLVAEALKLDKKEIDEMYKNGMQSIRMTYYPPCPVPEQVIGLTPHSDGSGITILHEVNGVEGLEIHRGRTWIPVKFLPHAFVVIVGDALEILSNGLYKSVEHRATVNSDKERISLGMFFNPKFEAEIGPATRLLSPENPPLFKRITMEDYVKLFFSRRLDGKSFLQQMKDM